MQGDDEIVRNGDNIQDEVFHRSSGDELNLVPCPIPRTGLPDHHQSPTGNPLFRPPAPRSQRVKLPHDDPKRAAVAFKLHSPLISGEFDRHW